jgi:outer membrane protein OmpA-like peptidoglycan-associated protein
VADGDPVGVAGGIDLVLPPGPAALEVESPGFAPFTDRWDVPARPAASLTVALSPLRHGTLCATLGDDHDAPLAGTVDQNPVPAEGACFRARAGTRTVEASAPGFSARAVPIVLAPESELRVHVQLSRAPVWREGSRLEVQESVRFALDSAEPDNEAAIDAVAAWLRAHPEVRLLRIEGHADATGDSAYNHELSLRRATSVRDRLLELGIDPARLEVVGTGEARRPGDDPRRMVEFWVIVWVDE